VKIAVTVSIGRQHRGDGRKIVSIHVEDQTAAVRFLDVEMTFEEFVVALMSGTGEGEAVVRGLENVGKIHQSKIVEVPFDMYASRGDMEAARIALAPHEVDGWVGTVDDLFNRHNLVNNDRENRRVRVRFFRWITLEKGEVT
jgi:hypothetical protein